MSPWHEPFSSLLTNVIPAKAGIQKYLKLLDPDFRRDDKKCLCQQTVREPVATMLKKIIRYLIKGYLPGALYNKLCVQWVPQIKGIIILRLYKILYRGIRFGKGIKCWGRVIITKSPESQIFIGSKTRLVSDSIRSSIAHFSPCKFQAFFNSKIIIGERVGLNGTAITCRTTSVEIGEGAIIAPNVIIVDSDFHSPWPPENRLHNMGYENDRSVKIGKNVWIGMNSLVLKGVTIGDNSIIAAGSVVNSDIPPNTMAGGVPARLIKPLIL